MVVRKGESVLDLAATTEAAAVCVAVSPGSLTGVDLLPEALALAAMNMRINGIEAELICADLTEFRHPPFDVIVCNPPYFATPDPASVSKNPLMAAARHENCRTLEALFAAGGRLLKDKGRFYLLFTVRAGWRKSSRRRRIRR